MYIFLYIMQGINIKLRLSVLLFPQIKHILPDSHPIFPPFVISITICPQRNKILLLPDGANVFKHYIKPSAIRGYPPWQATNDLR